MRKNLTEEWQKYPFLGVALPLMAGIVTAEYVDFLAFKEVMYAFFAGCFLLLTFLVGYTSYARRFLFGLILYPFLLMAGGILSSTKHHTLQTELPENQCLCQAVLMTNPSPKTRSVQCEAYLMSCSDGEQCLSPGQYVLLSFAKDSLTGQLKAGDTIQYYARMLPPRRNTNPGMFDYAAYLRHQGINTVAYLPVYAWEKAPLKAALTGRDMLPFSVRFVLAFRTARNRLLEPYHYRDVDTETVSVLSALTLGEVSGLPKALKTDYSVAGASHILALSGSHLAVLYAVLDLLFSLLLYRWKWGRLTGKLSIVLLIWGFVFLAGSQPSVVRAAVMYSLLVGASVFSRKSLSLNSLAAAAFFMLLADPFSLFDIGFQLSFLAVLGIILFNNALYKRLRTPYKIVNYVVSILTVSISVQLISFPLVLFYFSSFPLYFLLTNLLVVPVSSIVLIVALIGFFFQFVFASNFLSAWITEGLYCLVRLQNEGVKLIAALPYASLSLPGVTRWMTIWGYVMMLFLLLKKYSRPLTRWYAGFTFILIGIVIAISAWQDKKNDAYLVFYENRRCPALHIVKGHREGVLFPAWKDSVANGLAYMDEAVWRPSGIPYPRVITPEDGILLLPECRVLLLNDFRWINRQLRERLRIDYVWICRGFYGPLSKALSSFSIRMVILDISLSEKYRERYRQECLDLDIPFHDMAEKGAFKVILRPEG